MGVEAGGIIDVTELYEGEAFQIVVGPTRSKVRKKH
jgi:hypothetical protein